MDFPPPPLLPPPPSSFSHNQSRHHHQRYANVMNHPNYYPPPFTHHHPPPYILVPPSPHPPSRYTTYPPQFSEINSVYEFNRGNFPSRLNYNYSNQDPIFRDDAYRFRELGPREFDDFRGNNRYRDMIYCGRKLYNGLDDDERGFARGRDMSDPRRDSGMNAWEVEVYNKKNADLWSRGCRVRSEVGEVEKGETLKRKSCDVNESVPKLFNERDSLDSDRASDSLGRGVCDEGSEKSRKKMRVQKVRDFDRNELEKPYGSSCKGSFTFRTEEEDEFQRLERKMEEKEYQQTSTESIGSTFRSKANQGSKRLETRMKKKKKEREQSPIDVHISFRSNALVAKAIVPSSSRAVKADIDLTHVEENIMHVAQLKGGLGIQPTMEGISEEIVEKPVVNEHQSLKSDSVTDVENAVEDVRLEDISGSPMVKCTKNMEKPENSKCDMNIQFDVRGILQEHLDSKNSGNGSGTALDSDEVALENGTLDDDSGLSVEKSEENADKTEIALPSCDIQSASSHIPDGFLEKSAIDSNGLRANDVEDETLKDITHHSLLPLTGGSVIKRTYDSGESSEFQVCDSRIKRSRLSIFHSSPAAESRITRCPTHSERLVTFSEFSAHRHQWVMNEVADGASESCLPDERILVSLGFSPHAFNVNICICDEVSVLDSSYHAPEKRNNFSSIGNNGADDIVDPSFHDNISSSKPQQAKNSEIFMDEFLSVVDKSVDKSENIKSLVAGSEHVNLENVLPDVLQVGMDAVGMTSVDIADCSNSSSVAETNYLVYPKGSDSEVGISFPCTLSKSCDNRPDLLQKSGSVEETLEAISDMMTRRSIEDLDSSVPSNNELLDVVTAIDGEPATHLANSFISAADVDLPGSYEGVDSFSDGPSANSDVDFGEDSSSSGVRKKRRIFSSTVTSPSLLEDVRLTDGRNSSDCSSPKFPEWISGQQENTLAVASTSTNEYGTNGTEVEFCGDKLYVLDMDKTTRSCDDNYVKYDVSLIKNQSFSSLENSACTADSGEYEVVESDSDVSSCPSSPDDLLLYSDFSSPPITAASPSHPRSGMIYKTKPFNRGGVFTDRITLSPGNRFEKPSFDKAQSNVKMPVYPQLTSSNVVSKLHHTRGKFTLSKNQMTSPGPNLFTRSPLLSNGSKDIPSTNTTKSKTWTRTGTAPVAPAASKLQFCPLPQNRLAKISGVASSTPVSESKTWTRTGTTPVASAASKLQSCPLPQNRTSKISRVASSTPVSESKTWTRTGTAPVAPAASKLQSCNLLQNRTSKISGVAPSSLVAVKPQLQSSPPPWSGKTEISKVKRTWQRPGSEPVATTAPKLQACPLPPSNAVNISSGSPNYQNSTLHTVHNLVREPSPSNIKAPGSSTFSSSVYRRSPGVEGLTNSQASKSKVGVDAPSIQKTPFVTAPGRPRGLPLSHNTWRPSNPGTTLPVKNDSRISSPNTVDTLDETSKTAANHGCLDLGHIADTNSPVDEGNPGKKMVYVKRRSNQLIATSDSDDTSTSGVDKTRTSLSNGYYKSKKNQLVRTLGEYNATIGDAMMDVKSSWPTSHTLPPRSSISLQSRKGHARTSKTSKFSSVWKLHDAQSSEKRGNVERPQKLLSRLFSFKRAVYKRNLVLNFGSKPSNNSISNNSHKLLVSRKRAAVYTRSTHGYSLRMSKVVSVGGSSLKWSKSIDKKSKEANEDATRAVATAGRSQKEANRDVPAALRSRNYVSRERVFRVGSERYKMDPTRRTLHRITAEEKPSPSTGLQTKKDAKRSYVPKRLFIGYDEYVRTGNGNKLVRDPKKRTRILASEKIRWSLRTARMKLVRKKKYCQFFTKFGKCNKDDGKCPFIHDSSKVVVCTKFLNGSCSNPDCKLTHKVMPERMQDCSYFQKGSCSNENCPYRHVIVEPDSAVCDSFLRGYCPDGNECRKKHTYVCPAYEATGICHQVSTCKLHHPRKKMEKMKPVASEEKILKGRYFEGGPIEFSTSERAETGNTDYLVILEGDCPDYISLDASEDEMEDSLVREEEIDEVERGPILYSTLVIDSLCGGVD